MQAWWRPIVYGPMLAPTNLFIHTDQVHNTPIADPSCMHHSDVHLAVQYTAMWQSPWMLRPQHAQVSTITHATCAAPTLALLQFCRTYNECLAWRIPS